MHHNHLYIKSTMTPGLISILLIALISFSANAQCGSTYLYLTSQADVNNFKAQYPGCTEIAGTLIINGGDITNLDGLNHIEKINVSLGIDQCYSLTNLDGLSSLKYIGGTFVLSRNNSLSNIDGLSSLKSIGKDFQIILNDALQNINGLASLDSIGTFLQIASCPKLNNLDSLSSLISVGSNLYIEQNSSLSDISGLGNIELDKLKGSSGLVIEDNPRVSYCHLDNICAYLAKDPTTHPRTISNNSGYCTTEQAVVDACNNPPVCPLGDVYIYNQEDINRFLVYYPNCTVINGNLGLGTPQTSDLSPLHNLVTIKKTLYLDGSKVINLDGLNNITSIGQALWIRNNSNLQDLDGLSKLTSLGFSIDIIGNNSLENVDGLSGLTKTEGYFNIENNAKLTDLNGFSNTSHKGPLIIVDNATLADIEGIKNFDYGGIVSLTIKNNPLLSVCNYENICSFLTTSKPREITGNAGSCADEAAVDQACTMSITHHTEQVPVTLYPNPVHDLLTILLDADASDADFTILNADGKEVYKEKQYLSNKRATISVKGLPAGVYFLHITLPDNRNGIMKFVKQ